MIWNHETNNVMKRIFIFVLFLAVMLSVILPVSAESVRENPSVYSFAEIVQKLPKIWLSSPAEMMDMMKEYPDFTCWRSYDIIGCTSVNNKYSAEIHVNYQFTTDDDNGEFDQAYFSMLIDSSEDVQKLIEAFWLPGMSVANIWGAKYPEDQITLFFSAGDTMMKYSIPMSGNGEFWLVNVELGMIRG